VTSRVSRTVASVLCGLAVLVPLAACDGGPGAPGAATAQARQSGEDQSLTPTQYGPLSAADIKLMTIVRQTSLREITTSQWALQRSASQFVRQAAQTIIDQHIQLQARDLQIAQMLNMKLPDQPSPDMQAGIDRMRNETGATFDDDYTNTLRQAHAEALILIAKVRADTRNTLLRSFAEQAGEFIRTHIQVLEATGNVDYAKLPVPGV
jgi:putative membrane protein